MLVLTAFTITLLATAQTYAAATPAAPPSPAPSSNAPGAGAGLVDKLIGLLTVDSPVGPLTYYGLNTANTSLPALLEVGGGLGKRCGSKSVGCDGSNVPNTDPCASLIYGAVNQNGDVLPNWVRAICLNSSGQCCISWGAPTANLRIGALFNAAAKAFNSCVVNRRSGYTRDTNLNGVCTDQCLSNRPDGCT